MLRYIAWMLRQLLLGDVQIVKFVRYPGTLLKTRRRCCSAKCAIAVSISIYWIHHFRKHLLEYGYAVSVLTVAKVAMLLNQKEQVSSIGRAIRTFLTDTGAVMVYLS